VNKLELNRTHKDILKGITLVVIFWIVNTFIAFVIFQPTTEDTRAIIGTWFVFDFFIYFLAYRRGWITKMVNFSAVGFVIVLAVIYMMPVNSNFPDTALELNKELSESYEDRNEYANALFEELRGKWNQPIRQYLLQPHRVLLKDFAYFWELDDTEYVPSHVQGNMYVNLLRASDRFTEDEVQLKQSFCSNSPHGYVEINEDRVIWIDFWAADNIEGYKFGMRTIPPCKDLIGTSYP